jgi:hypothetical protein
MKRRPAILLLTLLAVAAVGGIFYFVRPFLEPRQPPEPPAPTVPAAEPYEAIISRALAGFNAGDASALFADFSASAVPAPTAETHRALFEGYYREAFGDYVDRRLFPADSEILPDRAALVWYATFTKAKPIRMSANFVMENGEPKIVQLRLEKPDVEE